MRERERGGGKEATHEGVDVRLDVLLLRLEPHPHGPHHDGQSEIHDHADAVGDDVAVALDKGPVEQRRDQAQEPGPPLDGHHLDGAVPGRLLGAARADRGRQLPGHGRGLPRLPHRREPELRQAPVLGEVDVDLVEEELGRVDVQRHRVADGLVVRRDGGQGREAVRLAAREEHQLVEQVEGRAGRLVDAGYDDELSPFAVSFRSTSQENPGAQGPRGGGTFSRCCSWPPP